LAAEEHLTRQLKRFCAYVTSLMDKFRPAQGFSTGALGPLEATERSSEVLLNSSAVILQNPIEEKGVENQCSR